MRRNRSRLRGFASCRKPRTTIALVCTLICLFVSAACLLAGCDGKGYGKEKDYSFVQQSAMYPVSAERAEDGSVNVCFTLSSVENPLAEAACSVHYYDLADGLFYRVNGADFTVSYADAEAAAKEYLAKLVDFEGNPSDGLLNIYFYYDTLNNKMESDGESVKVDDLYRHMTAVPRETETATLSVYLRYAATENWYAALVGASVLAVAIAAVATAVVKGVLWQKKKK